MHTYRHFVADIHDDALGIYRLNEAMKALLLFLATGVAVTSSTHAHAQGVFRFVEDTTNEVFAALELGGTSPYDHTDILGFHLTPIGASTLGYSPTDTFIFTHTSNLVIDDGFGGLAGVDIPGGTFQDGIFWDFSPPNSTFQPAGTEDLRVNFDTPGGSAFDSISFSRSTGSTDPSITAVGEFILVPEPTSLTLLSLYFVSLLAARKKR